MGAENECLGCGVDFDYDLDACPACGWEPADFAARGRYGLAKSGHGEPDDEGDGERDGGPSGPPPGPGGLLGF
jgi:protein PhnA